MIGQITTIGLTISVILANLEYGWNKHVWDVEYVARIYAKSRAHLLT